MGRTFKRWKWPIGAASAIVVMVGLNAVKASPEFTAAQSVSSSTAMKQPEVQQGQSDGADQWMDRRERHGHRGGESFGGDAGSSGGWMGGGESGNSGNNSSDGGGFRSSTRTS